MSTILHLDMDAFFAAIEQLDHPGLRGKPVVVGADPKSGSGRGVVSTCSYEARTFGIRSAMPISKAYRLCPDAVFLPPRGARYVEMSRQIIHLLGDFSPDIEQISIDEAFLDISSTSRLFGSVLDLAKKLKKRIRDETGLTASVGVAPTKFVAKIASDLEKPDGLVMVPEGRVKSFLAPLDISRLWGVGPKTLPRLHAMDIRTIGDLASKPREALGERLGAAGAHFWNLANGLDPRPVEAESGAKSMSKETTFDSDIGDPELMANTLLFLCQELCREMRVKGFRGRTINLKIRLDDFSTFTRSRTFDRCIDRSDLLYRKIQEMFDHFPRGGRKVRLLGVGLSHLERGAGQLELFDSAEESSHRLDRVIDEVRERFGEQSITRASLLARRHDSKWFRNE